jgi:predicted lactoylglutathione lyase
VIKLYLSDIALTTEKQELMMKLKTNLPKQSIELIEFADEQGSAEAGWFIYLNPGYSFDPMANDGSCFIPMHSKDEAKTLCVYKVGQ